jgi:hypothetical protein
VAKQSLFVPLFVLFTASCVSPSTDSEEPWADGALAAEIVDEMSANIEFSSTEQMLTSQGQRLLLENASVHYLGDSETTEGFFARIPVVNQQTGKSDRYSWLSYEQKLHGAPVVALQEIENTEPGYKPLCELICDADGICLTYCSPGGGGSGGSGGGGGKPACSTLVNIDTCHLSGVWTGNYCVDNTKHWSYLRKNRYNYTNGRKVNAKDTVYSCGSTAVPPDTNCATTCL